MAVNIKDVLNNQKPEATMEAKYTEASTSYPNLKNRPNASRLGMTRAWRWLSTTIAALANLEDKVSALQGTIEELEARIEALENPPVE